MDRRDFLRLLTGLASLSCLNRVPLHALEKITKMNEEHKLHEALFYEPFGEGIVLCKLCPHSCKLQQGQQGICRTRVSDGNKLYTLAYGNPVALHLDPMEKKPLYHFFPGSPILSLGTAGCNFRCLNCQNYSISQASPKDIPSLSYSPEDIVKTAIKLGSQFIAYTYTEPTVFFEYMYDTAKLSQRHGIKNVMISNGYIQPEPLNMLLEVIDAFNIDLKAFNKQTYRKLIGGELEPVLSTLQQIRASGKWLEITHLMVTGYTDKLDEFSLMVDWLLDKGFEQVPLHISRFFPAYKLSNAEPTDIRIINQARQHALEKGIKFVYTGNIPSDPGQKTYCPKCKAILIDREGYQTRIIHLVDGKCDVCGTPIPGVWK